MLKTAVLLNDFFVNCHTYLQDSLMNINYSKNSIDFITITVTFDQFNVSLMDKSIYFFFSFTKKN